MALKKLLSVLLATGLSLFSGRLNAQSYEPDAATLRPLNGLDVPIKLNIQLEAEEKPPRPTNWSPGSFKGIWLTPSTYLDGLKKRAEAAGRQTGHRSH